MTVARAALLGLVATMAAGEVLQVGGIIQSTGTGARGKAAFEHWKDWVNGATSTLDYTVSLTWSGDSAAADYTTQVHAITNSSVCGANCVDVIIAPYGSASSKKLIDAMPAGSMIPILVWGGASDAIFSTNCAAQNCFGTLTKASLYTTPSLAAIKAATSGVFTMATITNDNAFSASVTTGTKSWATANTITNVKDITISVKGTTLTAADVTLIDSVATAMPDVVCIAGHAGDVEQVIMQLRGHATYVPKAIIATNAFTDTAAYTAAGKLAHLNGVIMPDQWAESATMTDTITGWTTANFKAAITTLAQTPSYHAASAAGGAIAVLHAMAAGTAGTRKATLNAKLKSLAPTNTFYGSVSFASDGSIDKPMYGRQWAGSTSAETVVVPPNANLTYPMQSVAGTSTGTTGTDASGSTTVKATFAVMMSLATYAGIFA